MSPPELQEVLHQYRDVLGAELGSELERVVLYGSQARGDAHGHSDIDVLCVMRAPFDYGKMIDRTSELTAALSLKHDVALSRSFVTLSEYENTQTPFLMNVRKEGVSI